MSKWLCSRCYLWVLEPIWEQGGDLEVKAIPNIANQRCELFACSNIGRRLTSMPSEEYLAAIRK